jgi:hypothetical protein
MANMVFLWASKENEDNNRMITKGYKKIKLWQIAS